MKPKTKAELHAEICRIIDDEGLDYGLCDYTSPESLNTSELDPEFAKIWRDYIQASEAVKQHVGYWEG